MGSFHGPVTLYLYCAMLVSCLRVTFLAQLTVPFCLWYSLQQIKQYVIIINLNTKKYIIVINLNTKSNNQSEHKKAQYYYQSEHTHTHIFNKYYGF
jgi:hypothetical protein